jgi:hypothetical protein
MDKRVKKKKMWYIYTKEYYVAIKRMKLSFSGKWNWGSSFRQIIMLSFMGGT